MIRIPGFTDGERACIDSIFEMVQKPIPVANGSQQFSIFRGDQSPSLYLMVYNNQPLDFLSQFLQGLPNGRRLQLVFFVMIFALVHWQK